MNNERSDVNNNDNPVDRAIAERLASLRADPSWQPDIERGRALLRHQRTRTNIRRRRAAFIAAGAVAACLPIMAFPVTRALAERCVSACVLETAAVRDALLGKPAGANLQNTYVPSRDRRPAPDFTLQDASGGSISLSAYRGKVVLLNFWATWCAPCRQEIPWFIDFQRNNAQRGFAVLGVSLDDNWTIVKPFVDRMGINYPVMIGNAQIAQLFGGLSSVPLTVIIDRSGRVAAIHAGLCKRSEYLADVEGILQER